MLSLFPDLYDWNWYVSFVFRIFLACYIMLSLAPLFIKKGRFSGKSDNERWAYIGFGIFLAMTAMSFLFGFYTQIAGTVGFVLSLLGVFFKKHGSSFTPESKSFYLLIGLVSLSLVFLGPGPYSFDLPL